MRIKLLRDARIRHHAGETVEVSPAEAHFLMSVGSAIRVVEQPAQAEEPKPAPKRTTKKDGAKK